MLWWMATSEPTGHLAWSSWKYNGIDTGFPDTDQAEVFILDVATGRYDGDVPKMASDLRNLLEE